MARRDVAILGMVFLAHAAAAQSGQQGAKLVGNGAVGAAQQGAAVAISADGTTAILGGWADAATAGAAWVFTRGNGAWTQQGGKLVGTGAIGAAWQGRSVAISADGNTAIVGGPSDNSGAGAAWVFARSGGVWSQQGGKLVGSGAVGAARQGISVAISADGTTAIVGGHTDNLAAGAAWVFTRTGAVWSQEGSKLVGSGAVGPARQGCSVAISGDGNTAIVGGFADGAHIGAAWVFARNGGVWSQQGGKLVGAGAGAFSAQGMSVAISADGNTAVVGGPAEDSGAGASWVYGRSEGMWSEQGAKLVGTSADGGADQGWSVAISADGNTVVAGGPLDKSQAGAAWAFARSWGVWAQEGGKLVGTGAVTGGAGQGSSVAVSADGNTVIVGGAADNLAAGAAWIFVADGCEPLPATGKP